MAAPAILTMEIQQDELSGIMNYSLRLLGVDKELIWRLYNILSLINSNESFDNQLFKDYSVRSDFY
jgi:hypothetical protein